jgi:hypothetical protein
MTQKFIRAVEIIVLIPVLFALFAVAIGVGLVDSNF